MVEEEVLEGAVALQDVGLTFLTEGLASLTEDLAFQTVEHLVHRSRSILLNQFQRIPNPLRTPHLVQFWASLWAHSKGQV